MTLTPNASASVDSADPIDTPLASRSYRCVCGHRIFFGNVQCLACDMPLGYDPETARLLTLKPGAAPGLWVDARPELDARPDAARAQEDRPVDRPTWRRCANLEGDAQCNWLVAAADDASLCRSCRLNRTIPDLSDPQNRLWWGRIEGDKRRLAAALLNLRLPLRSRLGEDPEHGLAFDMLRTLPGMARVLTGHADGIITINVEEADDARREALRAAMREPYRTLLGHLRHEVGHYYWQRLVEGSEWHEPFRRVFGDERADYAAALKRHYDAGPPPDWADRHVSAYAASHPWEDWAETWAHYLHMIDTLDTAWSFGLDTRRLRIGFVPFTSDALYRRRGLEATAFLSMVNTWVELAGVLNELARSMGQPDFYPFVLPGPAVAKLQFVHLVIGAARGAAQRAETRAADAVAEEPAHAAAPHDEMARAG